MTFDQLTQVGHLLILVVAGGSFWKSSQAKGLSEIQSQQIETLSKAFEECKDRLEKLEKK